MSIQKLATCTGFYNFVGCVITVVYFYLFGSGRLIRCCWDFDCCFLLVTFFYFYSWFDEPVLYRMMNPFLIAWFCFLADVCQLDQPKNEICIYLGKNNFSCGKLFPYGTSTYLVNSDFYTFRWIQLSCLFKLLLCLLVCLNYLSFNPFSLAFSDLYFCSFACYECGIGIVLSIGNPR